MNRIPLKIALAVFVLSLLPLYPRTARFLEIDNCLDAGGGWSATADRCEGAPVGYVALPDRGGGPAVFALLGAGVVAGTLAFAGYAAARILPSIAGVRGSV